MGFSIATFDYRKVFTFLWQKNTEHETHPQVTHVNELDFISWLQALGTPGRRLTSSLGHHGGKLKMLSKNISRGWDFLFKHIKTPYWWCRLFSWESTIKINNLEITNLHMLTHASLRTQENNFGSKYVKIFQDYFANVRPQESNVHGGSVH